jgi:hypothetical protein
MSKESKSEEANPSAAPSVCSGEGKVWLVALLGLLVGMLVMYIAMPALSPAEPTVPEAPLGETGGTAFVLDEAKAQAIGQLLSDTYFLNTGQEVTVAYSRYEDAGSHGVLYYNITGQETPIYVSKDYKYLYPGAIDYAQMKEEVDAVKAQYLANLSAAPAEAPVEEAGFPLSAEPEVYLFVMGNCPYGNQAENGIADVVSLLEDEISFEPVYIIYDDSVSASYGASNPECMVDEENGEVYCSMHGMYELKQDVREKMVYNRYGAAKWAEYATAVNTQCFSAGSSTIETCWKTVADSLGIDSAEIEESYEAEKFSILAGEKELTFSTQTFGSPSLVINGKKYSGARTPEAFKAAICSAFSAEPESCGVELSDAAAAATGSCG